MQLMQRQNMLLLARATAAQFTLLSSTHQLQNTAYTMPTCSFAALLQ
jgi:hypothetical protein